MLGIKGAPVHSSAIENYISSYVQPAKMAKGPAATQRHAGGHRRLRSRLV